ncbi:MAG: hypothetical protein HY899_15715 [Deltaproteobacteria bacterium]|nr:hypothetical protein [Deltaproteobacteria bacterium]
MAAVGAAVAGAARFSVLAAKPGDRASGLGASALGERLGGGDVTARLATWGLAAAVFVVVTGYFSIFRSYGFQIEDEGTLLFQLERVARGQFPYVDFGTGYTPGFFYAGAWLLERCDFRVESLRAVVALLNAATAAGLYLIACRVAGRALALVAPLAWVAFLPVRPGDFAAFNIPYPAWPATLAWMIAALAVSGFAARGGLVRPAIAGLAGAAAFAIKPNAGAFVLAGTTWALALFARSDRTCDRVAVWASAAAMALGVWFALGLTLISVDAVVHLVPCCGIAALCAGPRRGALSTPAHPRALDALAVVALAFALPTLLWALPVAARLGAEGFAREVLLIGSGAADLYYLRHPVPQMYALAVAAAVLAIAVAGRAIVAGKLKPGPAAAALALAAATVAILLATVAVAPEGFRRGLCAQLENAAFWLAVLASYGALALLALRLARPAASARERTLAALVPLAATMYVQLYPRCDFMHLLMAVPLLLAVALALLARVASWWEAGSWGSTSGARMIGTLIFAIAAAVLVVRLGLDLEPIARVVNGEDMRRTVLDTPRIKVWSEASAADDLIGFGKTVDYLAERTRPGQSVLAFPALTGALFAAGLTSPVFHDYWYHGRPSLQEEAAMLAELEADPPAYLVTLNHGWSFFIDSPAYFTAAERFARERYRLVARFGRFDVLALRDAIGAGVAVARWQPEGARDAIAQPETAARRQAVRRWMAALTPQQAAVASLPPDRAQAILFLRGLRDTGDLRAAAWVLAGYDSEDPRLVREAMGAMELIGAGFEPSRHRWAGDFDGAAILPYVAALRPRAELLLAGGEPRAGAFASAIVSVTEGGDAAGRERQTSPAGARGAQVAD